MVRVRVLVIGQSKIKKIENWASPHNTIRLRFPSTREARTGTKVNVGTSSTSSTLIDGGDTPMLF